MLENIANVPVPLGELYGIFNTCKSPNCKCRRSVIYMSENGEIRIGHHKVYDDSLDGLTACEMCALYMFLKNTNPVLYKQDLYNLKPLIQLQ